ncbi:PRTRC system protein E [Acidicapsa dinghuensis]|uniref:PRTRC system protein E n=1 Tax=Acidicapsa dinghuensis TaxID=2218256 RepID=A0ABW1EEH0_9BACT|nr:PRTRC system protein E [Acidicapsa dinghuensis]
MFKELAPYLRQRAVLLTVTHLEDDQIRLNVIPQKLKDGENAALTTPLTVTGTADELDRDLPATLVNFVGAHLELRNTLDRAKAEMDSAAKTAQAEARSKSKKAGTKPAPKTEVAKPAETPKTTPPPSPEPARAAGLFDSPAPVAIPAHDIDEEEEILAEAAEEDQFSDED